VESDGNSWLLDPSQPFNLRRPVPSFGTPVANAQTGKVSEDDIYERLHVIERSIKDVQKAIANSPTRRLARKVRSVLPRKP
jgi:hypothetical protein